MQYILSIGIFTTAAAFSDSSHWRSDRGVWSGVYMPPLFENMGPVIRPNLHRNRKGGVGCGGIVLVILQHSKSQILVLLSDESRIF